MKKLLAMALAASTLAACNTSSNNQAAQEEQSAKTLILCYSQTGTTKAVAEEIQKQTGADIEYIECVNPYESDFGKTIERWQKEKADGVLPEIKEVKANVADYDVIFLGYPIWGGSYASPMASYLKGQTFEGKKVVPFMTFGSGGNTSINDLKAALPKAEIAKYFGIRTARIDNKGTEVFEFLVSNGYIEGSIPQKPEYSEAVPVTESDIKIFNEACGDYQYPLGTPVTVASRTFGEQSDFIFQCKSQAQDGSETTSTIYVTMSPVSGNKPEFTEVVR